MTSDNPPDPLADNIAWFTQALAAPFDERSVEVAGSTIHYQLWRAHAHEAPGILLVHGNGANAHWWDFIAPHFQASFNIAALDLSGMGDSGHRPEYSPQLYAEEVAAVATDAGFDDHVILVGHSFGGTVCRVAAANHPERVRALILLDSALVQRRGAGRRTRARAEAGADLPSRPARAPRIYPSREEAARRFRLRPPQPCDNDYILRHLALHAVRETDGGWCWKADHRVFEKMVNRGAAPLALPDGTSFPVGLIYGDQSRFFPADAIPALKTLVDPANVIALPGAHHHLFLEQPRQFVEALRGLLQQWDCA